jgi:hypothetical protein
MYEPIEALAFNIFDPANNGLWRNAKAAFATDNDDIKVGLERIRHVRIAAPMPWGSSAVPGR